MIAQGLRLQHAPLSHAELADLGVVFRGHECPSSSTIALTPSDQGRDDAVLETEVP